ncbi:MAG: thioredoxin-dependent peroxiredoxin [Solirubrobacterales bacterium]|jgi:peroxiredoxin Q/BCP|nr:thioredoxin-dependent peroxiredoxin [Solirubrobacterales bacterium]
MQVGDKAPEFTLDDQDGTPVSLGDFEGKSVVVYFYPHADTPGCTIQACGVRDRGAEYEAANAVVLGVSPDEPEALRAFADKFGLAFTLLADPDHSVAEAYGVWVEKKNYGKTYMGIERSTFIVGPDGRLEKIFRKVKPAEHDDLVLGALAP